MGEQNRDDFYEGPPLQDERTWHEGAVTSTDRDRNDDDDEYQPGPPLDHQPSEPLVDVEIPERGAYPRQEIIERPHRPSNGLPPTALTRDPSMSRAVDRAANDLPVEQAGYDRSMEGARPGPLVPTGEGAALDGDEEDGTDGLPAGQWGSSGSRP